MPFIVHCPHADCRKFMLLEDSTRGGKVECLICKRPIQVEASARAAPQAKAVWSGGLPAAAARGATSNVQACPQCQTPLRLPAGNVTEVKCPKCGRAFKL
jgi:uncharacterized Zn finger protein (UPF0148 family)